MYETFFHGLEEVEKDIGTEALPDWCYNDLKISLAIINRTAGILKANDLARAKQLIAPARKIEKQVQKLRKYEEAEKEKKRLAENNKISRERNREFVDRAHDTKPAAALQHLLTECDALADEHLVALGERYAEMKRAVESGAAGTDPNGAPWVWNRWAPIHLREKMGKINHCILRYQETTEYQEQAA